jgi:P-type conjugative transfer protein TrbG
MNLPRPFSLSLMCLGLGFGTLSAQTSPSSIAELLGAISRKDPLQEAYGEFERTGNARVIFPERDGGFILFPFGYARPTIRCPRLNACMIALEAGEELTDQPLSGDTERWIIDTSIMGDGKQSRLVVVKPQFCDISTNLLIPTDRRVYELSLASDACKSPDVPESFTRQVTFWYPDQMRAERVAPEADAAVSVPPPRSDLNRSYNLDRGWFLKRKQYAWMPAEVFDDGIRTFIVLPEHARNGELPILYMVEGGEKQVLNYALRGDTIVADRVLRRAVLVVDVGGGEQKVEIENRAEFKREEGDL